MLALHSIRRWAPCIGGGRSPVGPPAERRMFERSDIEMSPVDEPLVFEQVAFEPVAFEPLTFEPAAEQRVERSVGLRVEPTIDPDFEREIEPTVGAPFD